LEPARKKDLFFSLLSIERTNSHRSCAPGKSTPKESQSQTHNLEHRSIAPYGLALVVRLRSEGGAPRGTEKERRRDKPATTCAAVESVPGKVGGAWVFHKDTLCIGTSSHATVVENLQDGLSIDQILALYDGLTREQINAVLDFAAHSLSSPSFARQCEFYLIKGHP
jgi:uncharacterized protein (DUF433 family)